MILPLLALCSLVQAAEIADETDFSTPPSPSWTEYNPLVSALFDFSSGDCRLFSPAPASPAAGPARAGLFAPTVFTDCVASVDLTFWAPTTNRAVDGVFPALFTRAQDPVNGVDVGGYALSTIDLGNGSAQLQLFLTDASFPLQPVLIAGPISFPIDAAKDYRLVLRSIGEIHIGRIFDLENLSAPLAEVYAISDYWSSGRTGISVATDRLVDVEARFDRFLTWDGSAPPLSIGRGPTAGSVELSVDWRRFLAWNLEATTDLAELTDFWLPITPPSSQLSGNKLLLPLPSGATPRFFRLGAP